MNKMSKKSSTDQRFIPKRNTTYKIGTLVDDCIFLATCMLDGFLNLFTPWEKQHGSWYKMSFYLNPDTQNQSKQN